MRPCGHGTRTPSRRKACIGRSRSASLLHGGIGRRVWTLMRFRSFHSDEFRSPEFVHPIERRCSWLRLPTRDRIRRKPDGQAPAISKGRVILSPIRDQMALTGFVRTASTTTKSTLAAAIRDAGESLDITVGYPGIARSAWAISRSVARCTAQKAPKSLPAKFRFLKARKRAPSNLRRMSASAKIAIER
jgi:hypothetical protein